MTSPNNLTPPNRGTGWVTARDTSSWGPEWQRVTYPRYRSEWMEGHSVASDGEAWYIVQDGRRRRGSAPAMRLAGPFTDLAGARAAYKILASIDG